MPVLARRFPTSGDPRNWSYSVPLCPATGRPFEQRRQTGLSREREHGDEVVAREVVAGVEAGAVLERVAGDRDSELLQLGGGRGDAGCSASRLRRVKTDLLGEQLGERLSLVTSIDDTMVLIGGDVTWATSTLLAGVGPTSDEPDVDPSIAEQLGELLSLRCAGGCRQASSSSRSIALYPSLTVERAQRADLAVGEVALLPLRGGADVVVAGFVADDATGDALHPLGDDGVGEGLEARRRPVAGVALGL